jgi:hypothetical protein
VLRLISVACGIALGLAGAWGAAAPAGADTVPTLQARAAQLASQLTEEQLAVSGYQQQYETATAAQARDVAAIARAQRAADDDRARLAGDRRRLATEALTTYVDAGDTGASGASELFETGTRTNLQRTEYQQMAVGDIEVAVVVVRDDQARLAGVGAQLAAQRARDAALVSEKGALLAQAGATRNLIEQQQGQVNGQLEVAVEHQQSLRAAQAVAAVHVAAPARPGVTAPAGPGVAPPTGGHATSDPPLNPFLQCVVQRESSGNYGAVSPNGDFMGAFQFSQGTWNEAASLAGLPALVGVPPNLASKADQDTLAVALYAVDGERPWYDPCRSAN